MTYISSSTGLIEIERKFLMDPILFSKIDQKDILDFHDISQGYLAISEDNAVRVRLCVSSQGIIDSYMTVKGKPMGTGLSRLEYEFSIPPDTASDLLKLCKNVIIKRRFIYKHGEDVWEIDQFKDYLEGLWFAEIELKSEDQQFVKPVFVTEDISLDHRYYNSNLHRYRDELLKK